MYLLLSMKCGDVFGLQLLVKFGSIGTNIYFKGRVIDLYEVFSLVQLNV